MRLPLAVRASPGPSDYAVPGDGLSIRSPVSNVTPRWVKNFAAWADAEFAVPAKCARRTQ